MSFKLVTCVVLAAMVAGTAAEPTEKATPSAHLDGKLWQWLTDNGAALNFVPAYSDNGIRMGVAMGDIPAGGLIASIPMRLSLRFPANWTDFPELGELLLLESRKEGTPFQPYFDSLPSLHEPRATLTWESMPTQYLHLLQDGGPMTEQVLKRQGDLEKYWAQHGARLTALGVTLEQLRGAVVAVSTRWFEGPPDGEDAGMGAMIPGLDALNHRNTCPITFQLENCPNLHVRQEAAADLAKHHKQAMTAVNSAAQHGDLCVVVKSNAPVPAGSQLCVNLGHLTPDMALMQYGFLLHETAPEEVDAISRVDERGATMADLVGAKMHSPSPPPVASPFNSAAQIKEEKERVDALLARLVEFQPTAEKAIPAPNDPKGQLLDLVLTWRRQRISALTVEAKRLAEAQVAAEKAAAAPAPAPAKAEL